jgi:hypothetical protein
MGKPDRKAYEYKVFTKQPILSELDELNKLGRDGWKVVCCPNPNVYLLIREKNG